MSSSRMVVVPGCWVGIWCKDSIEGKFGDIDADQLVSFEYSDFSDTVK